LLVQRDAELIKFEGQMRMAIRDAVNRASRKPFEWGGLAGYRQLEAIGQALHTVLPDEVGTAYWHQLADRVDRVLEKNRALAQDVAAAHIQLEQIADCLRYPPRAHSSSDNLASPVTSQQVREKMECLLEDFKPDFKRQPAQATLYHAWHHLWKTCSADLLHCYDIPNLPQDNLQLEAFFGRLRRNQRRISGHKSTVELRNFGQCQVLFTAQNREELLGQIREVPLDDYKLHRRLLEEAEEPRKLLYRLHRDPLKTSLALVNQHAARRAALASGIAISPLRSDD
jgi:hypothetical protein